MPERSGNPIASTKVLVAGCEVTSGKIKTKMNITREVKDYIGNRPAFYDMLKRTKRRLHLEADQTYDGFDQFSRAHPRLRFVQIGAADGLRNDPIREFVLRDK